MTGLQLPDFLGIANRGVEIGQKRGLAQLMGQAMQAPRDQRQGLIAKMAGTDPQAAYDANKHFEGMDDSARERLGQYAAAFDALPDEQKPMAYPKLAQQAQELGIPAPAEWNPAFAPNIQKLAMSLQGGKGGAVPTGFQELHMKALAAGLRPGSPEYQQAMNINLGREGRAATGGFGFELIEGIDGSKRMARKNPRTGAFEVYDETTGDFSPMGGAGALNGGPMAAPQPASMTAAPSGDFAATVASIVAPLGGRITSTTGGRHNVGSNHPGGGAVDVGMGQESPEEQARILAALQANPNLVVTDERIRPPGQKEWSGPHLHVEPRQQMAQGGNPGLAVSRRPEDEAAAKTNAEESVKLGFLPRTEAIKADAAVGQALEIERGKADVERAGKQIEKDTAMRQYEAAMKGLTTGLAGTTTNPIAGRLPAVTANQQIAEGGVAAFAPILKQLFRSAGEGTFTDRDQEILLAMLPTRKDHPEARKAKLANIDTIIRAKLQQGSQVARDAKPSNSVDFSHLWGGSK